MYAIRSYYVALLGKRHWLTGLVILLALVIGMNYMFLLTPRLSRAQAHADTHLLRVMTFNVHYSNRNAAAIVELIDAESPRITSYNVCYTKLLRDRTPADCNHRVGSRQSVSGQYDLA